MFLPALPRTHCINSKSCAHQLQLKFRVQDCSTMALSENFSKLSLKEKNLYDNIFTLDVISQIKTIVEEEFNYLDGSFMQYYTVADVLYDATMLGIMELKKFDNLTTAKDVIFKSFQNDAKQFRKMLLAFLMFMRTMVQKWIHEKPTGTCKRRIKKYLDKLHPEIIKSTTNNEDWCLILGAQLKPNQPWEFSSKIQEVFDCNVIIPIFDEFVHLFD